MVMVVALTGQQFGVAPARASIGTGQVQQSLRDS
jgi:hypothetical protein